MKEQFSHQLSSLNRHFQGVDSSLGDLLFGRQLRSNAGSLYGYLLEVLCGYAGSRLDNSAAMPLSTSGIESFDSFLEALGLAPWFRLGLIHEMPSPIELPAPDGWPCYAILDEAAVAAAYQRFNDVFYLGDDAFESQLFETVKEWLALSAYSGWGLALFYY